MSNLHSIILVLLLLLLATVISANQMSPEERFVKEVNDVRREYAKKYNVPDMHGLIWSKDLAALKIKSNDIYKSDLLVRTTVDNPTNIRQQIDKEFQDFKKSEFLYPLQLAIGCSKVDVPVCMIGPHVETRKFFDTSTNSSEVPGSQCSAKFKNVDGLCVAKEPERMSYFHGDPQEFVKDVNLARRIMAKRYNVTNMHELVWNASLVDIAKAHKWAGEWRDARKTWRYLITPYPGIVEVLTQKVEQFSNLTKAQRTSHIEQMKPSSIPLLEILNPRQETVGCTYYKVDWINVCLLGNSGTFDIWDFDKPGNGDKAGSNCGAGYKNNDGLCSIAPPTTAAPSTQAPPTQAPPTQAPPTLAPPTDAPTPAPATPKPEQPQQPAPVQEKKKCAERQTDDEYDSEDYDDVEDSGTSFSGSLYLFYVYLILMFGFLH